MAIQGIFKRIASLLNRLSKVGRDSGYSLNPSTLGRERLSSQEQNLERERQSFDRKLTYLANAKKSFLAGSLELIGLGEIKAGLGKQWPLFAERVVSLAEEEMRRSLDPSDSFRRHGDLSFLVHFCHLDKEAAQSKAKETAARIKAVLLDKMPAIAGLLRVRTFVGEIDAAALDLSAPLSDALFARLVQMRIDVVDDLRSRRKSLVRDMRVRFSPIWRANQELTILNRCIVDRMYYKDLSAQIYELEDLAEVASISSDIDYITFTKSLEALHELRRSGRVIIFLVPVEITTIQSEASQQEYLRLLGAIPKSYRKFIVLEVLGIGQQTPFEDATRALAIVRPFVKSLVVELAAEDKRISQFAKADIWAMSAGLGSSTIFDRSLVARLTKFVSLCEGKETMLANANTIGLVRGAMQSGVIYIEGTAVHLPGLEPRPIQRSHFTPAGLVHRLL